LQRIAGAQIDVYRVFGYGSALAGAAFWQGNNAMIRRAALEEISEVTQERGFSIKKCIRDRTLLEDTETTIDLLAHGWEVFFLPDPEILAYAGTPRDFGSLLIQRRRWAGGGLLNVPKLLSYLLAAPNRARRLPEAFLRLHYLGVAAVNLGFFLLPILAIVKAPAGGWWLWTLGPFYLLYAHDLLHLGYTWTDVPRSWPQTKNATTTMTAASLTASQMLKLLARCTRSRAGSKTPNARKMSVKTSPHQVYNISRAIPWPAPTAFGWELRAGSILGAAAMLGAGF
jgi:hypothetical protein